MDLVKFFRRTPAAPKEPSPGFIVLREGDEIQFGGGYEGEQLGKGPIPRLTWLLLELRR